MVHNLLSGLYTNSLDHDSREGVDTHKTACPYCRRHVEDFRKVTVQCTEGPVTTMYITIVSRRKYIQEELRSVVPRELMTTGRTSWGKQIMEELVDDYNET